MIKTSDDECVVVLSFVLVELISTVEAVENSEEIVGDLVD